MTTNLRLVPGEQMEVREPTSSRFILVPFNDLHLGSESGYLVKNPSILIKKVAFIRKYEIHDGR